MEGDGVARTKDDEDPLCMLNSFFVEEDGEVKFHAGVEPQPELYSSDWTRTELSGQGPYQQGPAAPQEFDTAIPFPSESVGWLPQADHGREAFPFPAAPADLYRQRPSADPDWVPSHESSLQIPGFGEGHVGQRNERTTAERGLVPASPWGTPPAAATSFCVEQAWPPATQSEFSRTEDVFGASASPAASHTEATLPKKRIFSSAKTFKKDLKRHASMQDLELESNRKINSPRRMVTRQQAFDGPLGAEDVRSVGSAEAALQSASDYEGIQTVTAAPSFVLSGTDVLRSLRSDAEAAWAGYHGTGGRQGLLWQNSQSHDETDARSGFKARILPAAAAAGSAGDLSSIARRGSQDSELPPWQNLERQERSGSAKDRQQELVDKSTAHLLGMIGSLPEQRSCKWSDSPWPSWKQLREREVAKRDQCERAIEKLTADHKTLQDAERRLTSFMGSIERLHAGKESPWQKEMLALQLLLEINDAPYHQRQSVNAIVGKHMAIFCSQGPAASGWAPIGVNLTVQQLAKVVSVGGSIEGYKHRLSVGHCSQTPLSIEQLLLLPDATFRKIIREYAAALSALLVEVRVSVEDLQRKHKAQEYLARLGCELAVVIMSFAATQSVELLEILHLMYNIDDRCLQHASKDATWMEVVDAAGLSDGQKDAICAHYRAAQAKLGSLKAFKAPIKPRLVEFLGHSTSASRSLTNIDKNSLFSTVVELKMQHSRRSTIVLELGAAIFLQVCSPLQAATIVGKAFPLMVQPMRIGAAVERYVQDRRS